METWQFLETKQVQDADGFYTDYTLWYNEALDQYVCILGDNDVYTPENTEPDFECDSEHVAYEWFDNYTGFEDEEDEASEEPLTPEGFYEMFSVACEPDIMQEAAQILYDWYSEEGEELMPEYLDILDMCDAATDDHEKYTVLYALGEIDEDEYYSNA